MCVIKCTYQACSLIPVARTPSKANQYASRSYSTNLRDFWCVLVYGSLCWQLTRENCRLVDYLLVMQVATFVHLYKDCVEMLLLMWYYALIKLALWSRLYVRLQG